jgi:hypothetical protein
MRKKLGLVLAAVVIIMLLLASPAFAFISSDSTHDDTVAWSKTVRAYKVTGDVTSGWSTEGGTLWYDVLKETATSSAGGYDDTQPYTRGVIVRPPSTSVSPNPLNPTNHNWIEVDYILVTGQDDHRALYSVGELDPRFGNGAVTLTPNKYQGGYDMAGLGREVKKVSTIDVVHAFTTIKGVPNDVHPYSPMLVVSGAGIRPRTHDLADLQAMNQVTFDASSSTSNTYGIWTGPTLSSVLRASGIDTRDMDSYIVVQATDGYATVLSMYEATHQAGGQYPLLAINGCFPDTGKCSINCDGSCSKGENGVARLVIPGNLAAGRWVSNVAQIMVFQAGQGDHPDR